MTKERLKNIIRECLTEGKGPYGKENAVAKMFGIRMMMSFSNDDRKTITQWYVDQQSDITTFKFYFKKISQLSLEKIMELTEKNLGEVRLYPDSYSIVVEIRVYTKKVGA